MAHELYQVTTYEPIQISPCIGSGLRGRFRGHGEESNHATAIVAMAVCRVKTDWYQDGRFVREDSVHREVCGVVAYFEEGFGFCEEMSNFLGYLQPGESE